MTNKNTLATLDFTFSSGLSSFDNADAHLDFLFKSKTDRPAKLDFIHLLHILQLKRKYSCETWLGLYRCILDKVKTEGLDIQIPHYSNFLKSIKKLLFFLFKLIYYQVKINKQLFLKKNVRIASVDSTPLPVCKVIRSNRHKTMNEFAEYSKSTTGWYYGSKLHLTTDFETNEVLDSKFSSSKLDDRKYLAEIMKDKVKFLYSQTEFVLE